MSGNVGVPPAFVAGAQGCCPNPATARMAPPQRGAVVPVRSPGLGEFCGLQRLSVRWRNLSGPDVYCTRRFLKRGVRLLLL